MLTPEQIDTLRTYRQSGRNRLEKAMELAGVTQVELATRTRFTQSYISKVTNGQYADLPGETMRAFASFFGCSIEDLFPAREAVA